METLFNPANWPWRPRHHFKMIDKCRGKYVEITKNCSLYNWISTPNNAVTSSTSHFSKKQETLCHANKNQNLSVVPKTNTLLTYLKILSHHKLLYYFLQSPVAYASNQQLRLRREVLVHKQCRIQDVVLSWLNTLLNKELCKCNDSWVLLTTMCAGEGDLASLSACLLWRLPAWTSSSGHFICRYWMAERKKMEKNKKKNMLTMQKTKGNTT